MSNGIIINKDELEELYDIMKNIYDYERGVYECESVICREKNSEANEEFYRIKSCLAVHREDFNIKLSNKLKYKFIRKIKGDNECESGIDALVKLSLDLSSRYIQFENGHKYYMHGDYPTENGCTVRKNYTREYESLGDGVCDIVLYKSYFNPVHYFSNNYIEALAELLDNIGESSQCVINSGFLNNINKTIQEYQNG